jgi:hypothetical protein
MAFYFLLKMILMKSRLGVEGTKIVMIEKFPTCTRMRENQQK